MTKYSKKGLEKRKADREGYAEFFQKHAQVIRSEQKCCEECGNRLQGEVSEIAHIVPKNLFKSIATEDRNVLYMCGRFSENQCHSKYDESKLEVIEEMKIFPLVVERFKELEEKITEKIPYKVYERFGQ